MNNLSIYEYLHQNDNSTIFNNTLPPMLSSTTTIVMEENKDTAAEKVVLQQFLTNRLSAPYFFDDVHEIRGYLYSLRRFYTITTLTIPEGIEIIGKRAFDGCSHFKILILPNSLRELRLGAFANCPDLENIYFPDSLTEIGDQVFQNTSISELRLPANLQVIGNSSFKDCYNLQSIEINGNGTSIGESLLPFCLNLHYPHLIYEIKGRLHLVWTYLHSTAFR